MVLNWWNVIFCYFHFSCFAYFNFPSSFGHDQMTRWCMFELVKCHFLLFQFFKFCFFQISIFFHSPVLSLPSLIPFLVCHIFCLLVPCFSSSFFFKLHVSMLQMCFISLPPPLFFFFLFLLLLWTLSEFLPLCEGVQNHTSV